MKISLPSGIILVMVLVTMIAGCGDQTNPVAQEQDYSNSQRGELRTTSSGVAVEVKGSFRGYNTAEKAEKSSQEEAGMTSLLSTLAATPGGPYLNFRFLVEIEGITQGSFSEAWLTETTVEVVEYREGNESNPASARKLPGRTTYGNLILKWGITTNTELYDWFRDVTEGDISRAGMSVILLDEEMVERVRWNFAEAWPVRYDAPEFVALGNDVAIETLEIAFEEMDLAY